jgi:hypothetical protein
MLLRGFYPREILGHGSTHHAFPLVGAVAKCVHRPVYAVDKREGVFISLNDGQRLSILMIGILSEAFVFRLKRPS